MFLGGFWGGGVVFCKFKFVFCCIVIKFRKNVYKEFIKFICLDLIILIVVVVFVLF